MDKMKKADKSNQHRQKQGKEKDKHQRKHGNACCQEHALVTMEHYRFPAKIHDCCFYVGPMSRIDAEVQLQHCVDGTFLVRDSDKGLVLSVRWSESVESGPYTHVKVECYGSEEHARYRICAVDDFSSVVDLVRHYACNPTRFAAIFWRMSRSRPPPFRPFRADAGSGLVGIPASRAGETVETIPPLLSLAAIEAADELGRALCTETNAIGGASSHPTDVGQRNSGEPKGTRGRTSDEKVKGKRYPKVKVEKESKKKKGKGKTGTGHQTNEGIKKGDERSSTKLSPKCKSEVFCVRVNEEVGKKSSAAEDVEAGQWPSLEVEARTSVVDRRE